jgi:hypothetical protein
MENKFTTVLLIILFSIIFVFSFRLLNNKLKEIDTDSQRINVEKLKQEFVNRPLLIKI